MASQSESLPRQRAPSAWSGGPPVNVVTPGGPSIVDAVFEELIGVLHPHPTGNSPTESDPRIMSVQVPQSSGGPMLYPDTNSELFAA